MVKTLILNKTSFILVSAWLYDCMIADAKGWIKIGLWGRIIAELCMFENKHFSYWNTACKELYVVGYYVLCSWSYEFVFHKEIFLSSSLVLRLRTKAFRGFAREREKSHAFESSQTAALLNFHLRSYYYARIFPSSWFHRLMKWIFTNFFFFFYFWGIFFKASRISIERKVIKW